MRRAFSLLDVQFQENNNESITYFLLKSDVVVARIKITNGGRHISTKQIKNVKIIQDKVHTKWYQKILSPFISSSEIKCRLRYNCIDTENRTSIGTITFDQGYNTFVSNVRPPYMWTEYPHHQSPAHSPKSKNELSEILPSLALLEEGYQSNILNSCPDLTCTEM